MTRKLERKGIRSETAMLGDARVHYWEGGEGPPVVLLHGFGASAVWQWHEQMVPLARDHRVIAPDLLWFGGSWSNNRDFSIDYQFETVTALLDHLGVEQAGFVGISYGGIVAHELAAQEPERVRRLAIVDSPGRSYTVEDHAELLERFKVTDITEVLVPDSPEDVEILLEIGYYDPPRIPRWVEKQVFEVMYSDFREEKVLLLSNLLEQLDHLDERPGHVMQETLLIWGDHDPVFPLEIGTRLEADMGGIVTLRVVNKARHAPNLEYGDLVAQWLVEWFSG